MGRALAAAPLAGAAIDGTRPNSAEVQERRAPPQAACIDVFCAYLPAVIGAAMGARRSAMGLVGGWDATLPPSTTWTCRGDCTGRASTPCSCPGPRCTAAREWPRPSKQEVGHGEDEVALYTRHRGHGMRRRSIPRALVAYARLLVALVTVPRPGGAAGLATRAGLLAGRRGSLRYRSVFL